MRCLHTCYSDYTRNSFSNDQTSKDGESPELSAIKKYGKCKIECYKQQVATVESQEELRLKLNKEWEPFF